MRIRHFSLVVAGLLGGVSTAALGQGAALSSVSEDIVVTAQKREQSLMDVGLTVAAATTTTLLDRGISSTEDLGKLVPGFTVTQSGYMTPIYTLRGVGLFEQSIGATPAVAVYVDEIARPFSITQPGMMLDLERVEVLKGPQGTLFGQSSTGGAINYIAAKPTDHFAAGGNVSYERFGRAEMEAYVSGPIADTLKGRLAGKIIKGGAWQYSVSRPDDKNGDTDFLQGRILLDWEPDDRLRFNLNVNGFRDKSQAQAPQFLQNIINIEPSPGSGNPFAQINPGLYATLTDPSSPGYDSSFLHRKNVLYSRLRGLPFAPGATVLPNDPEVATAFLGGPNGDGTALCDGNNDRCIRQADWDADWPIGSDDNFYQFALRTDFDVSDSIVLTSLTSYQKAKTNRTYEADGTTAQGFSFRLRGGVENFSQELRLSGSTGGLTWLIGGNYDWAKTNDLLAYYFRDGSALEPFPGLRFTRSDTSQDQRIKSYAAFANVEYQITPELTVLAGVRYTNTKRRSSNCNLDPSEDQALANAAGGPVPMDMQKLFGLDPAYHVNVGLGECWGLDDTIPPTDPLYLRPILKPFVQNLNEDNVSFRIGANYKTSGGTLLYATVSRGYKAGLFTGMSLTFLSQLAPAVQERVMAYEAGFKAPVFDNRLQVNAAGFYYDYRDKQLRASVLNAVFGPEEIMMNVPKSYIWGLEAEILARPINRLNLSISGTYLKSKVSDHFSAFNGSPIFNAANYIGDFKGSPLPYTPQWSGVFDGQYELPISARMSGFFGSTVVYQSKTNTTFHTDVVRADDLFMRSRAIVDLRAGLAGDDGAWRLTAYVQNLTSKFYETTIRTGSDVANRMSGRPRIYGLQLRLRTN